MVYRDYLWFYGGLYKGNVGDYIGACIGRMEKKMETTIQGLGLRGIGV